MIEETVKYIVIATVVLIILNFVGRMFTNFKDIIKSAVKQSRLKKISKKYIKEKDKEEKELTVNKYFGLFEILIDNSDDEETIRRDCCSIIKDKIKAKYVNHGLVLTVTDKIFFNCSDFSIAYDLVEDIVKLFNFFVDIHKKRKIRLTLKFSLWAKPEHASLQEAYKILSQINSLDFENFVMANNIFYKQYKKEGLKGFDFCPHGIVKLVESDEDVELYRLLKSSVPQSDDK